MVLAHLLKSSHLKSSYQMEKTLEASKTETITSKNLKQANLISLTEEIHAQGTK